MLFSLVATGNTVVDHLTFADYVAACFGGVGPYVPRDGETFKMPAGWLCLCACIAFVTLDYPVFDRSGWGASVLVRVGNRRRRWASLYVWTALTAGGAFVLVLLVCLAWAAVTWPDAGNSALLLTPGVQSLLGFDAPRMSEDGFQTLGFLFAGLLCLVALNLFQTTVSTATAPVCGFAVVVGLLLISALCDSPLLLGNYLMVARSVMVGGDGMVWTDGLALSLVVAAASFGVGRAVYVRRDVRGRESTRD
jgi:hypothetical protein